MGANISAKLGGKAPPPPVPDNYRCVFNDVPDLSDVSEALGTSLGPGDTLTDEIASQLLIKLKAPSDMTIRKLRAWYAKYGGVTCAAYDHSSVSDDDDEA